MESSAPPLFDTFDVFSRQCGEWEDPFFITSRCVFGRSPSSSAIWLLFLFVGRWIRNASVYPCLKEILKLSVYLQGQVDPQMDHFMLTVAIWLITC
ncbi:hypothetical protein OPV22_011766 [Ensete ventricosum]|uniref:Uncharacterized protein n=1 Tax=Ensete ventricosum TaxID=4639 RepID=A0AAV8RG48_ENSVE|nr:hypothetical protein OPV22_011766 [Ensete ventricosum]